MDVILGSDWEIQTSDWGYNTYTIDQHKKGTLFVVAQEVILWNIPKGGSVGNGHGRYNGNTLAYSPGQWETGDYFCFDEKNAIVHTTEHPKVTTGICLIL